MTARSVTRIVLPWTALALAATVGILAFMAGTQVTQVAPVANARLESEDLHSGERGDLSDRDRRRIAAVTRPTTDFSHAEPFEAMSGGAGTSTARPGRDSLAHPAANLPFAAKEEFQLGSALFEKLWVSSPSSTQASDGLGPLYNARACETCHVRDGRGHAPDPALPGPSLVLRLVAPPGAPPGDPVYGRQLQDSAVPGLAAEGRLAIRYEEQAVTLPGGETARLRRPAYTIDALSDGPLDPAITLSPRLAPPMTGLGLIEAIHPDDILAQADPEDRNGDGVSGRAAILHDPVTGAAVLGRFGWKAEAATVRAQATDAFATDIGISTPDVMRSHGDCTARQTACLQMEDGVQPRLGASEAPGPILDLVAFYARHLAVPARRSVDAPDVLSGKQVFAASGCTGCHTAKFVTRRDAAEPAQSFQLIWPYSDFLLHDMGAGLADGDRAATQDSMAREWRTPPLWAIGLARTVDGRAAFLHDGRARTLTEAILWHGGEAGAARDRFASLDAADRRALLAFLESL